MKPNHKVMTRMLLLISALLVSCSVLTQPFSSAVSSSSLTASSDAPLRVGFLGDSSTDEYQGTDNRGGTNASGTYNWMELLVLYDKINAGEWGDWPEPRRVGYEYNWSRSAATVRSLLDQGQHTALAEQVANGEIDLVIINIGINDFAAFNGRYELIYNGEVAGDDLETGIANLVADYTTAVDTILAAKSIPVIITTVGDQSLAPAVINDGRFSDPTKRQLVTNAIKAVNTGLIAMADERGVAYLDMEAVLSRLIARVESGFNVGGESISMFSIGDDLHNGLLSDGIHAGTVLNGIIANEYLELINAYVDPDIPLLTDSEILTAAGIK